MLLNSYLPLTTSRPITRINQVIMPFIFLNVKAFLNINKNTFCGFCKRELAGDFFATLCPLSL